MNSEIWTVLLKALPPGMTVEAVSKALGKSEETIRRRGKQVGYKFSLKERYVYRKPSWVIRANWRMSNIEISREFGMSRERVRQWRLKLGKSKVESRGRKCNNGSENGEHVRNSD